MRALYNSLMEASRAHARWEMEVSNTILKDRKKLLILLALFLPVLIPAIAHAAGVLPDFIGSKSSYGPTFYTPGIFYGSMAVGVIAGLITGCIGAGGGFVITPALMSLGVKGILAVGTDMFHIFAKAIMGTTIHKKLGNVHVGLAIAFLVGSGLGVTGGGIVNRELFNYSPVLSNLVISSVYVIMLGFLGFYALYDYIKASKSKAPANQGDAHGGSTGLTNLAVKVQSVNIPPMITFDNDITPGGRKVSGVFVAICGAVVGFMAAILGVGGGFLTFPAFVYILGVSSFTTVGTDILQIIFTAGYGSIAQYAVYGYVFYTLAIGMLVGSLLGIQLGAVTTKVVPGIKIRAFYALAILAGFVNRLFALPDSLQQMNYISMAPETSKLIANIGTVIFFAIVGIFAAWIIITFITNIPLLRAQSAGTAEEGVRH
ncbi:MAG: membrane protein [Peptococcaceae bacterium BICA1-7]|nr:MAG: membrane protein [Peptococcaceae bacterium BICA1-7]HBV99033.1 sulfite exporter TauE/SafE family protein [Desulfotomaculum sp.]